MRLVGYVRVSTDKQAEEGLGIEIQEKAICEWASGLGHTVSAIYRDEGISGSNGLDTRVGLADAIEALHDGEAEGLVVYRLDRLARDLVLQEQLLAEVGRLSKVVVSTSGAESEFLTDDPNDPSRALIRQVLGAVSQYERSVIAMRLRAGRKRKAEKGGFAYGSPPLGYRAEGKALVPNEAEELAVTRILELRASTPQPTLRQIAQQLEDEGIPAKRSHRWHSSSVHRVLKRSGKLGNSFENLSVRHSLNQVKDGEGQVFSGSRTH